MSKFIRPQIQLIFSKKEPITMMQTAKAAAVMPIEAEPRKLLRRIGSTTYKVAIRFSETATETLEQKMLRLIEREVTRSA
jgi:hypothetical protein